MMKRFLTILATALVASTLLTGAAEARGGGGGGGHMGGGGFGGHMGGIGHIGGGFGGHIGGVGERMGGVGRVGSLVHVDHPYGFHGTHHFNRFGLRGYYDPACYQQYPYATIPPYCG